MSIPSKNLLTVLHRWASRQDENFITDAFAHLLGRLLEHDPAAGVQLLERLTDGQIVVAISDAKRTVVSTQVTLVLGKPDVEITSGHRLAFIESKIQSRLGTRQLERYLQELDARQGFSTKVLVLLSRYPMEVPATTSNRVIEKRWYQIADWLREERESIQDRINVFLTDQFIEFLKSRGITMEKVGSELSTGVRSLHSLVEMLEEAIASTKLPRTFTLAWDDWVGFNMEGKKYFFGIYSDHPEIVVFETFECPVPEDADLQAGMGRVVLDRYRPSGRRWVNELQLDSETVHFFDLLQSQQMQRVEDFLRQSLAAANKIGVAAPCTLTSPPSP